MNRDKLNEIKAELGWKPQPATDQVKPYVGVRQDGDLAYISGHVAVSGGVLQYKGRVGKDITIEQAKKSAMLSIVNVLDLFDEALGLERLDKVLKMTGFISCTEDIIEHPQIMNAASEILVAVFGDQGYHARAALGIHTLPLGASVEIDLVVKVKSDHV